MCTRAPVRNLYHSAEAHESHGEEAGRQEGNRRSLHRLRYFIQCQLLADTCEKDQRKAEAKSSGKGKQRAFQHPVLRAHRQFLRAVCYQNSHTENTTVGRDKRQEDTKRLIQCRADLLQYDLNHLHEGSDDEDEEDGLQELQAPCHQ